MVENIKKTQNLISIITIVRNGVNEIEETIKSVLSQKNVNLEYIIIDGKSTDGTLEIIEKYKDNITIVVSEPDHGIYDAINKGIKLATGELIGLIHCGDYYESDAIQTALTGFLNSKADIIYGDQNIIEGEIIRIGRSNHEYLKKGMTISHPATFVSHNCYQKNGLYNTKYKIAADYAFFLMLYMQNANFFKIDKVLANFRAGGISGSNFKLSLQENISIRKKHFGKIFALRYSARTVLFHYYFLYRKKFIETLIGKNKYLELKRIKYSK